MLTPQEWEETVKKITDDDLEIHSGICVNCKEPAAKYTQTGWRKHGCKKPGLSWMGWSEKLGGMQYGVFN